MASVYGVQVEEEAAKEIVMKWREANPCIVNFWYNIESAASKAVTEGNCYSYRGIKFGVRNKFLYCRLPSGRLLAYYNPAIEEVDTKYQKAKPVIAFHGVDSKSHKWARQYTYGGKLTENIVQAVARDILAEAMLRLEHEGYSIVMHVHDEIVAEAKEGADLKEFERIMSIPPIWADGCPIAAEGWSGERYKK
jgi:DNA polymerase